MRLDAFIAGQLPAASRAKISASIRAGLVAVNGRPVTKPAAPVRAGDAIDVALLPPEPCTVGCVCARRRCGLALGAARRAAAAAPRTHKQGWDAVR